MEKRGVIESGRTPAENEEKQATADQLEDHVTKRAADTVTESTSEHTDGNLPKQPE